MAASCRRCACGYPPEVTPRISDMAAGSVRIACRFFARPKKTITKSQYVTQAKVVALRAQELAGEAKELRNEENAGGRNRKWRAKTKELGKRLSLLEDEERELEKQFPQVRLHDASCTLRARAALCRCTSFPVDFEHTACTLP